MCKTRDRCSGHRRGQLSSVRGTLPDRWPLWDEQQPIRLGGLWPGFIVEKGQRQPADWKIREGMYEVARHPPQRLDRGIEEVRPWDARGGLGYVLHSGQGLVQVKGQRGRAVGG